MNAVTSPASPSTPWRSALVAFALLELLILGVYRDSALGMVDIWQRSETFAHCMLVPPIALWLVWRRRFDLAALAPRPQPWVLLPLLAVTAVWLLAEVASVNVATQFAFMATLVLAVPAVLGVAVARTVMFPLLFLFLAVPFGEFALPWMMEATADFVVAALQMTGIPVYREGQHFIIPSGSWSVIDECSGIRYLMASFMVGSLFAYLNYRSWRRRAAFMVVSIILPIVANWLRAYLIVMVAHLSGNKLAVGVDHILYGWVFFGVIILAMFFVGARWSEPDASAATPAERDAVGSAGPVRAVVVMAALVALVAVLPHGVLAALRHAEGSAAAARVDLPEQLGNWRTADAHIVDWTPDFNDGPVRTRRAYAGPAGTVGLHLDYYRGQTETSKLVTSQHLLVGMRDDTWALPAHGARETVIDGDRIALRRSEILGRVSLGGARQPRLVVWRLYWIDGRYVGGDVQAKLAGVFSRLAGRGDEGASLLLYADASENANADAAIEAFLKDNHATLGALLQRVRDAR